MHISFDAKCNAPNATAFSLAAFSFLAAIAFSSAAFAQRASADSEDAAWVGEAYGGNGSRDFQTPYQSRARDSYGTRLVVNGRIIDLGPESSFSTARQDTIAAGRGMLRGPAFSASSIGNYAEINAASNSTIFINQYNSGSQNAAVGVGCC